MSDKQRLSKAQIDARKLAFLRVVYRFRIGLERVLSEVLMDGASARHISQDIAAKGWFRNQKNALPGSYSFATCTKAGLRRIGVKASKAGKMKIPSGNTLEEAIAVSCFCVLADHRRWPLLSHEIEESLDEAPRNISHVMTDEFDEDGPAVLRVFHATGTNEKQKCRDFVKAAQKKPTLALALERKEYGLAVLCPTPEKLRQVKETLSSLKIYDTYRFVVSEGPTSEFYADFLSRREGK